MTIEFNIWKSQQKHFQLHQSGKIRKVYIESNPCTSLLCGNLTLPDHSHDKMIYWTMHGSHGQWTTLVITPLKRFTKCESGIWWVFVSLGSPQQTIVGGASWMCVTLDSNFCYACLSYQEGFAIALRLISSLRGQRLKVELKASVGVHHSTALWHTLVNL